MNINRIFAAFLYNLIIYLLLFNEWNLVESNSASKTKATNPTATSKGSKATTPTGQPGEGATPTATTSTEGSGADASGGSSSEGTPSSATESSETAKKTGVVLDIKKSEASNEFNYNKKDKIATYTAKDNYAFKLVKQENTEIWKTDNENEYATKVVLNGKGKSKKEVTIHLSNGTTKSYKKEGKNKQWNEYNGLPTSTSTDKKNSSNSSNESGFELNIKDSDDKGDDQKFDMQKAHGGSRIYTIKGNAKCTTIKCHDKEVWKYDSSKNHGYPQKINYNKENNKIIISFPNAYLEYNKDNDKWELDTKSSTKDRSGTNSTSTGGGSTGTLSGVNPNESGGGGTTPGSGAGGTPVTGGGTDSSTTPGGRTGTLAGGTPVSGAGGNPGSGGAESGRGGSGGGR